MTTKSEDSSPAVDALQQWYDRYKGRGDDRMRVSVWFPSSVPHARLVTVGHGCHEPDTLPSGPPMAHLDLCGLDIGGPLEDLELLIAAAAETLVWVRKQYDEMKQREDSSVSTP